MEREKRRRAGDSVHRVATLYDAVAGRVGVDGFIRPPRQAKNRNTTSTSTVQVPPDEVLFRRRGADVRYAENDVYEADRNLPASETLPDSDLLKAIHEYAAHFYRRAFTDQGKLDFESLDETALLAMGILLEEAAVEALGQTGDLALVEDPRLQDDLSQAPATFWHDGRQHRKVLQKHSTVRKSKSEDLSRARSDR